MTHLEMFAEIPTPAAGWQASLLQPHYFTTTLSCTRRPKRHNPHLHNGKKRWLALPVTLRHPSQPHQPVSRQISCDQPTPTPSQASLQGPSHPRPALSGGREATEGPGAPIWGRDHSTANPSHIRDPWRHSPTYINWRRSPNSQSIDNTTSGQVNPPPAPAASADTWRHRHQLHQLEEDQCLYL